MCQNHHQALLEPAPRGVSPGRRARVAEVVLLLLGWALAIASMALFCSAHGWHFASLPRPAWTHSTYDAAVAAVIACALATVIPRLGVLVCPLVGVALVVKAAMLASPADDSRVPVLAAISPWLAGLGSLCALRRRRLAKLSPKSEDVERGEGGAPAAAPKKARGASFGRLMSQARPELSLLVAATCALFLATASQMAMPHFIGLLIGSVTADGASFPDSCHSGATDAERAAALLACKQARLQSVALTLVVVFTCGGLFAFLRSFLFTLAGERVVARMRRTLFSHLMQQDVAFFDTNKTGELMNRLAADTTVIQNAVTVNVSMGLRFAAQVVVGVILIFLYSWKLSLVMLSVVPLVMLVAVIYGKMVKRISKAYQQALADASDMAQQSFSSLRTVRSFAAERKETGRYVECVDRSYAQGAKKALAYGAFGGVIGTVGQYAVVLVLWYGGSLTVRGDIDPGQLTAFLLYTVMIAAALGALSDLFGSLMNALGASERVFGLLDTAATIPTEGGARPDALVGRLQFEGVGFAYPSRRDVKVLDGVTLTVEPGSVVALCGPSGSGKSSVIALLERWYDPDEGRILLDGVPLAAIDPAWWRRSIALVAQEPVLFASSVADNIGYGVGGSASEEAIERAAATANAHEFIASFPEKYATMVGERGVQLSGGQKQRIAIARALLMDPKVLLLDEATSALDAESEHVVQQAIDRLMSDRTTIVVAHRLSTVRGADLICAVHKGRIVERGTHDELIKLQGIYFKLVKRQLAGSHAASFDDGLDVAAAGDA